MPEVLHHRSLPSLGCYRTGIWPIRRYGHIRTSVKPSARGSAAESHTIDAKTTGDKKVEASATELDLASLASSLKSSGKRLYDKVYYGDLFAPTGSFQLSYARLLELLHRRKVKRLILLSDGKTAIVEMPVENTESDFNTLTYDRRDLTIQYAEEVPEWKMEKNRYYCELPGDAWEEGTLMRMIKENQEKRVLINGQLRIPYDNLLKLNEVRPELQVVDPGDSFVFLNTYSTQFLPIIGLLGLRMVVGAGDWVLKKLGKQKKSAQEEMAEELGRHRATAFNVEEDAGDPKNRKKTKKDTGVRYEDVAGIDAVKDDIKIVLDILLGGERFREMGAHPIKGVLLEGPPGTGKTLLAKAMAGEAGIPFYSANGAEFVEMFQGVAAARIRSLFAAARKNAPAIIFIDEIDAIGKARDDLIADSGSAEREQGLLQLLTEMDGFFQDDQVLVIGATNLASALDDALLRPGRFDRTIHMGRPTPENRLKILKVHAKGKPIDRSDDDKLLGKVADLAIGYSGAELANLLNEAAILAVRKDSPQIDMDIMKDAMSKIRVGLPQSSIPDSPAKKRFAVVEAARAVAFALTPGLPEIQYVTIKPRGGVQARILFVPQEPRSDGGTWHALANAGSKTNATMITKPLSQFELCCELMTPLYVPRCVEELLYGQDGVTLLTSKEISKAGALAKWLVVDSKLHPSTRGSPVMTNMYLGEKNDPTTAWQDTKHGELIEAMQRGAYMRAWKLVNERRQVIETIAMELCTNDDETVSGERIVHLLESSTLQPFDELVDDEQGSMDLFESLFGSDDARLRSLAEIVMGRVSSWDMVPSSSLKKKAEQVKGQLLDEETKKRLESVGDYALSTSIGDLPIKPVVPDNKGVALRDWIQ
jgi:cell division protease FtsH